MWTKRGIWGIGLPLSAALDWCKRTASRYRRVAGRIADRSQLVGRENQFEPARVIDGSHPLDANLAGECMELRKFTKTLNIGDRIRVLCDDGLLVAEKVSETQFKVIQTETMAELVQ
jgi:hypothetical protein